MPAFSFDPSLPDALDRLSQVLRQSMLADPHSMSQIQLSDTEERESVRQAIDESIRLLVTLKTYRNYVAPISFLPNEILARVFFEYVLISDPWSAEWTRILLVCRKWHDVAVAEARLWSWISESYGGVSDRKRTMRWLDRSKGFPLQCRFRYNLSRPAEILLLENYQRIKTLELDGECSKVGRVFEIVHELPIVEHFSIHTWISSSRDEDEDDLPSDPETWYVPSFIVNGGAPRLRSLSLESIGFANNKDFNLLQNLTRLKLSRSVNDNERVLVPSLSDLVHILQRSPRLQELTIRHYIDRATITQQHTVPPPSIPLQQLRRLELNMSIAAISALIPLLMMPGDTHLSLLLHPTWHNNNTLDDFDHLRKILIPVRLHTHHKEFPTLRSMCFNSSGYFALSFSDQPQFPKEAMLSVHDSVPLKIVVYPVQQKETRSMLSKIMHAVPLSELSYVDASMVMYDEKPELCDDGSIRDGQLSPSSWRKLFALLLNPVTIKIGVNDALRCMLAGALEVLRRGHKFPSGRAAKRLARSRGCPSFNEMILLASYHPGMFQGGPNYQQQQAYYETLLDQLAQYQALEGVSKSRGVGLAKLTFDHVQAGYTHCYDFCARLSEVTERLVVSGFVWDPVIMNSA